MTVMNSLLRDPLTRGRDGDLYRAFLRLDRASRRGVALRILRNQKVLADLYDHFLIQAALRERGRSTRWEDYLHKKRFPAR
jgi:hypothetical protein